MAVRPTEHWREGIAIERREVASGQLDPEDAVMGRLFPESLLSRTDEVLASFESDVRGLSAPSDAQALSRKGRADAPRAVCGGAAAPKPRRLRAARN